MIERHPIINHVLEPKTLLDNLSDIGSWGNVNRATLSIDTEKVKVGSSSVKLTGTDPTALSGSMDKDISLNFRNKHRSIYFRFYVYGNPATDVNGVHVYLSSTSNFSKYLMGDIPSSRLNEGWNYFILNPDNAVVNNGENWDNEFIKIRLSANPAPGKTCMVTFDGIYVYGEGIPNAVITFDDGWDTVYTAAFPIMKELGLKGTAYIVPNFLGRNNYMNEAKLRELHEDGWCIANHTINHGYYLSENWDPDDYADMVKNCIDWLRRKGYGDGAFHLAYPQGEYDQSLIKYLKSIGIKTARTVHQGTQWNDVDSFYELTTHNMGSTLTLERAKSYVDQAIVTGCTVNFMFHRVPVDDSSSTTPSIAWSVSKFEALMNYLVEKRIRVVTIDEWYKARKNVRYKGGA